MATRRPQTVRDALSQGGAFAVAVGQEIAKRLRSGGKAARHTHACVRELADHFAQRRIFAADRLDVRHAKIFEGNDVSRPQIRSLVTPRGCYVGHDNLFDGGKSSFAPRKWVYVCYSGNTLRGKKFVADILQAEPTFSACPNALFP